MKKLLLLAALMLGGCSDPKAAIKALDDAGFTEIKTTGWPFFTTCGRDYSFKTGFEAKNPNGKQVSGIVCSGWLAGSTIKFN